MYPTKGHEGIVRRRGDTAPPGRKSRCDHAQAHQHVFKKPGAVTALDGARAPVRLNRIGQAHIVERIVYM
jgi:hypothetical protein